MLKAKHHHNPDKSVDARILSSINLLVWRLFKKKRKERKGRKADLEFTTLACWISIFKLQADLFSVK